MATRKLFFRILLTPLLFASCVGGLKSSLSLTLYLSRSVGEFLTLVILCSIAFPVYLVFRRIKPNIMRVWNFEYQIVSKEVGILIVWYFLVMFLIVTIYMILVGVFSIGFWLNMLK